jgi:hypothetical protein
VRGPFHPLHLRDVPRRYVSKGAFGKQSRLSKQKHQITAVAMDLMLNEKEILAVSCRFVLRI